MTTVLTWNIWHGGGKRVKRIAEAVFKHNPDIIILTEFRYGRSGEQIIEFLETGGLVYQTFASTTPRMNSVLVASRLPFEAQLATGDLLDNEQRCIKAVFSNFTLFAFYFPLGNKKSALYKWVHELPANFLEQPTLLIGDFNTGQHLIDEKGATFYCEEQFTSLNELGWIDIWRSRNPGSREYSWYSNKGNGFRIDHAFASPLFDNIVENVEYSHNERISGISDHSMLILKLDCTTRR